MQDLKDVLLSINYNLPHSNISNSTFRKYIIDKLTSFLNDVTNECQKLALSATQNTVVSTYTQKLSNYISTISDSINKFYNGYPDESYKAYEEILKDIEINNLLPLKIIGNDEVLYRIRESRGSLFNDSKDLFHVPLNLRPKINNQRFSIAGVPCLYLSNSVYVSWEELRRPRLDDVSCSAFKLRNDTRFLNLSTEEFYQQINSASNIEDLVKSLILFPLYFICSIKLKTDGEPFKPEYIFPQFTLRWTRTTQNIHGVLYSSTRVNKESNGLFYNLALPVMYECITSTPEPDFCSSLANKLKSTKPIQINTIKAKVVGMNLTIIPKNNISQIYSTELADIINYDVSIFYKIDQFLKLQNFDIITF